MLLVSFKTSGCVTSHLECVFATHSPEQLSSSYGFACQQNKYPENYCNLVLNSVFKPIKSLADVRQQGQSPPH